MPLSKALTFYYDGGRTWEMRIADRVYGHLVKSVYLWWLYRPNREPLAFPSMQSFHRWTDEIETTGLLERAA